MIYILHDLRSSGCKTRGRCLALGILGCITGSLALRSALCGEVGWPCTVPCCLAFGCSLGVLFGRSTTEDLGRAPTFTGDGGAWSARLDLQVDALCIPPHTLQDWSITAQRWRPASHSSPPTLNYRNYGMFLIMGNAGFISSTVVFQAPRP